MLWLRACLAKSLNPKVIIYKEGQMKNENTYYIKGKAMISKKMKRK
jgi:hypothetical protein